MKECHWCKKIKGESEYSPSEWGDSKAGAARRGCVDRMSNDFKAFMLVMLVVFSINYCRPNKIDRDNKRLDLDYTTAVRG